MCYVGSFSTAIKGDAATKSGSIAGDSSAIHDEMTVACNKHGTAGSAVSCFAITDKRSTIHGYSGTVIDEESTTVMVLVRSEISRIIASYTAGQITTVDSQRTVHFVQCCKTILTDRELMLSSRVAVIQSQVTSVHHTEQTFYARVTDTVTVKV